MKLRATYDGSRARFEGNLVLRLQAIPAQSLVLSAKARMIPISDHGGTDPFTEVIDVSEDLGDLGTTNTHPSNWVEIDFHTRRTVTQVNGAHLQNTTLQVDVGGGTYADINDVGGFKAPGDTNNFPMNDDNSDPIPGLSVAKLKLTAASGNQNPTLSTIVVRTLPSNVSLRLGQLAPFWTHTGDMTQAETTPDFGPVLQKFLTTAKPQNGVYSVPITLHSDALSRITIELEIDLVNQSTAIPAGLKEVVQPYGFSSLPNSDTDVLQVTIPLNARVVPEFTSVAVKGGFADTRVVLGPTGGVSPIANVEVSSTSTAAQPFSMSIAQDVTGVDLLIVPIDATATLQLDFRMDLDGKPANTPLFTGAVQFSLNRKPIGENPWTSVPLPSEFHLDQEQRYWLVLQCISGSANWSVTNSEANQLGMQASPDGGLSWRTATAVPPSEESPPFSGVFRLRRKPQQFQVPIELQVGKDDSASRTSLQRFAPLGRVDFTPDQELQRGVTQYLTNVAAKGSVGCPETEHLANGDFLKWLAVGTNLGDPTAISLPTRSDAGSVVSAPDGKQVYVGMLQSGSVFIAVIDVLCDASHVRVKVVEGSFAELPLVTISPDGSRLYVVTTDSKVHLLDLTGYPPVTLGLPVGAPVGSTPHYWKAIAIDPGGNRLYVGGRTGGITGGGQSIPEDASQAGTGLLDVFDLAALENAARSSSSLSPQTINVDGDVIAALAVSPDGSRIFAAVIAQAGPALFAIDATQKNFPQVGTPASLDADPSALAVTPDGSRILVVGAGLLSMIGSSSLSLIGAAVSLPFPKITKNTAQAAASAPNAIVISPDGKGAFIGGPGVDVLPFDLEFENFGPALTVDRGNPISSGPMGMAITPQGDRVYIASATNTPLAYIAIGNRNPADWMLTSGSVRPVCLEAAPSPFAVLGELRAKTGANAAPSAASGLSQLTPISPGCTYQLAFHALSALQDSLAEVHWLNDKCGSLTTDQIPIPLISSPGTNRPGIINEKLEAQTALEYLEQATSTSPQPTVPSYSGRFVAPSDATQAEIRFTVPAEAAVAIGSVSLTATAEALINGNLQTAQGVLLTGWTFTPQAPVAFSVIPFDGGVQLRNVGFSNVVLSQDLPVQGSQAFSFELQGSSLVESPSSQNSRIELHWLKPDHTSAGITPILECRPTDFDVLIASGITPADAVSCQVRILVPSRTRLVIRKLSLRFPKQNSIPLSFIAYAPGQLTVSELHVAYEEQSVAAPKVPAGGLCTPTPPDQCPGCAPADTCYCQSCRQQQPMVRMQPRQTLGQRPAIIGQCAKCGSRLIRLGGRWFDDAPQLPFPILRAHRKPARAGPAKEQELQGVPHESEAFLLTDIVGIGRAREKQLRAAGIDSVQKLAQADPETVVNALTGVTRENASHFIEQAKDLLAERTKPPNVQYQRS